MFREVSEKAKDKNLRDHWRKRFDNEYDDSEEFKDPDGCRETKENEILGIELNKLHDEWFKQLGGNFRDQLNRKIGQRLALSLKTYYYDRERPPGITTFDTIYLKRRDMRYEVILNGDSPAPTRVIKGVVQPVAPTTAEQ
nr:hypothetical protein [Tanacetum cinerariifolium]